MSPASSKSSKPKTSKSSSSKRVATSKTSGASLSTPGSVPPTSSTTLGASSSLSTPSVAAGGAIPIPDPPPKDDNYDDAIAAKQAAAAAGIGAARKKKAPPAPPGHGLAGHLLVKQLLGTAPPGPRHFTATAGTPSVGAPLELKLEELDEKMLSQRKKENEWFRNEIESTEKDTVRELSPVFIANKHSRASQTEYIRYLLAKKEEKQAAIDRLQDGKKKDLETFACRRKEREAYNKVKIEELKATIADLELKLESKQQEMMGLSDIISKRSRHEAEIIKIRQDIADADALHAKKVATLERSLLETRIKLQREADAKIREMENAAQEKAAQYLAQHTAALEVENKRLEEELRTCIMNTQALLRRKDAIERENKAMEREQKVREDMLKLRVSRVAEAQLKEKKSILLQKSLAAQAKLQILENLSAKHPDLKQQGLLQSASDNAAVPKVPRALSGLSATSDKTNVADALAVSQTFDSMALLSAVDDSDDEFL
ncbi:hypothetical protein HDU82_008834 [Entophlyctis luteolus]|nr:hypothetical protein HDU82_008834 [Entophlyctis luteolus]